MKHIILMTLIFSCLGLQAETLQDRIDNANGVPVVVGDYTLTETLHIWAGESLVINGTLTGYGFPVVRMYPGSSISSGTIKTDNVGILLEADANYSMVNPVRIDNVNITGDKNLLTGDGILMHIEQTAGTQFIKGIFISNVSISFFDECLHVFAEDTESSGLTYINAVSYQNVFTSWCRVGIHLERGNDAQLRVSGHLFDVVQFQPKPGFTERALLVDGAYNQFVMLPWDSSIIEFTSLSKQNIYYGFTGSGYYEDAGWNNRIE